jgi:MFS family permease
VKGRLLAAVAIAAGLTPLNSTMIAVALPAMRSSFNVAAAMLTAWVVTGYLVAVMSLQIPAGTVSDRIGYERALNLGRWLFLAGTAVGVVAPALAFVVLGRFLMAAGGALMVPTAMALIRVSVAPERRPSAFGAMGAVMGTAAALGPAVGGFLTAQFGWRSLFLVNVPLIAASWLLQPRSASASDDTPSHRGTTGLVDLTFLRIPVYAAAAGVIALQNLAMYALLFQIPFLYAATGDSGESRLGLVMMAMTATMAAWSPLGGRIAERVGVRRVIVTGGWCGAAGIALLTQLSAAATLRGLSWRLLIVGFALGLSTGPAQASAMSAVDQRQSAMAAALLAMLRYAGGIAGTAILSVTLGRSGGSAAGHRLALWCFAASFAASALCALVLPSGGRVPSPRPLTDRSPSA